ncbi:hypothetical protein LUX31_09930 [Streptomyces sp. GQFP]|nr:alpha/beta hydrolase-fold protein [Streptomyces sp. GQFP]UIX35346.1 hypothetical protein LUX31_09930 [Streptomyces sp. GQFP]
MRLLTPDGWERRRHGRSWPVLYLLHGGFEPETYKTWIRESDIEDLPQLRDVLVVMPEGGQVGFYSNWRNHGSGGPPAWETFHLDELRPLLEHHYGAGTRRAVAGLSMGGFGAVSYTARRPGLFRAAASFSGPVHLLHPRMREVWPQMEEAYGGSLDALWGDRDTQRPVWHARSTVPRSSTALWAFGRGREVASAAGCSETTGVGLRSRSVRRRATGSV